ncbi:hypothetical protein PGTUg99_005189 [Puccinia graminis f. sp. tritici]|uniref:Uncharacterized protein n=1 Tax=Puccinia graminis f. sp. tritici TaxID=56615 RepID=A0A5B0QE02_PUCGR|nr:hypothetical protein PGTUg99_005189 [Puccinia graminis f. sp. tritici]
MAIDPLQSISNTISQPSQNPNPNPLNTNSSSTNPSQPTTVPQSGISTPIPKQPLALIPSAPSKSNPHQSAAETRLHAQLNPGQIQMDNC